MDETVSRRGVDLCCLQETRWKKDGVKQIVRKYSRFKMFWSGNDNGTGGVGILLAEDWWEGGLRWSESLTGLFSFE